MNYVRVSASYLFNITLSENGKDLYLLVKSDRRNQYQPIGGCYKYFTDAFEYLQSLGFIPEKKSNGVESISDIRMLIPEENIDLFLQWYDSGNGRETSFNREFIEEVVCYLPEEQKENFNQIDCLMLSKGSYDIFYDTEKNIQSIKPMDIISIKLTPIQYDNIKQLAYSNNDRFILATKDEIKKGYKLDNNFNKLKIGSHTGKILKSNGKLPNKRR